MCRVTSQGDECHFPPHTSHMSHTCHTWMTQTWHGSSGTTTHKWYERVRSRTRGTTSVTSRHTWTMCDVTRSYHIWVIQAWHGSSETTTHRWHEWVMSHTGGAKSVRSVTHERGVTWIIPYVMTHMSDAWHKYYLCVTDVTLFYHMSDAWHELLSMTWLIHVTYRSFICDMARQGCQYHVTSPRTELCPTCEYVMSHTRGTLSVMARITYMNESWHT